MTEQIGPAKSKRNHSKPSVYRQWMKRQANRLARRVEKRLLEDAPKQRRYFGYE